MTEETFTIAGRDDIELFVRHWPAPGPSRAVVQIAHGMAEHSGRYARLAAALGAAGFDVYAHDHRGHGRSVRSEAELGHFGPDGWNALVADLITVGHAIDDRSGGAGRVLLGHSMGSFALQQYLLDRSSEIVAAVLSGTSAIDAIFTSTPAERPLGGISELMPFEGRTNFDWLSRDPAEVDTYIADPACGFEPDAESVAAMAAAADRPAGPEALGTVRPDLPILLMSGSDDPLSGNMALVELVAQRYRDAGVLDVTVIDYRDARHEIFNETNRDEVTADLLAWLDKHIEQ